MDLLGDETMPVISAPMNIPYLRYIQPFVPGVMKNVTNAGHNNSQVTARQCEWKIVAGAQGLLLSIHRLHSVAGGGRTVYTTLMQHLLLSKEDMIIGCAGQWRRRLWVVAANRPLWEFLTSRGSLLEYQHVCAERPNCQSIAACAWLALGLYTFHCRYLQSAFSSIATQAVTTFSASPFSLWSLPAKIFGSYPCNNGIAKTTINSSYEWYNRYGIQLKWTCKFLHRQPQDSTAIAILSLGWHFASRSSTGLHPMLYRLYVVK